MSKEARTPALAGMAGPGLFFIVVLLAGVITPGYDAMGQFASELSIGPLGWIMIANFIVFGLLVLLFGIGLWSGFGPAMSARAGAVLVSIVGIALVLAGVFVTDPEDAQMSAAGAIHLLASVLVFLLLSVACFVFAWRFRSDRLFALYSVATGIAIPPLFLSTASAGGILGLVQRILIAIAWTWLTLLAVRLYREIGGAGMPTPAGGAR